MIVGKIGTQYYPNNQVFNLQEELINLLYGDDMNPGIGQQVLVRRMSDKKCVCWDANRGSANPDCRYCQGEGYLWVETLNTCYLARNFGSVQDPSNVISRENYVAQIGYTDENRALAYFEASAFPNYERYTIPTLPTEDSLYELKVDATGRLVKPVIRTAKWNIKSVTPHRGDYGAVQMIEVGAEKEFV